MIPDRAKLARLDPQTRVGVAAGELLALLTLADARDADCRGSDGPYGDEPPFSDSHTRLSGELGREKAAERFLPGRSGT